MQGGRYFFGTVYKCVSGLVVFACTQCFNLYVQPLNSKQPLISPNLCIKHIKVINMCKDANIMILYLVQICLSIKEVNNSIFVSNSVEVAFVSI